MRIRETGPPGEREFLLTLEPGEKVMESLREVVVHAHVVCAGRDLHAVGGHLVEATSAVTVELRMVETRTELAREVDGLFGLKLLNLRDDGREGADPSPSRNPEA